MENDKKSEEYFPTASQLEEELKKEQYRRRYAQSLRRVIQTLVTVAAAVVLIAVLLLPVLRIYGTSMTPTLSDGDIVLSIKGGNFDNGDIIAFYYNNKILVKRVIAQSGEWVDIAKDGTVYVDGTALDEPYVEGNSYGDHDIEFPYQVPDSRIFVMGDHRDVSVDSRNASIGCVAEEQVVGKIVFRVWPLKRLGTVRGY